MHGNDWFYAIELPVHFHCEHPLGSVLGRADYGDYFFVYQGTTVGGNRSEGILAYPVIGDNVIMFANSTILGNSHIIKDCGLGAYSDAFGTLAEVDWFFKTLDKHSATRY